MIATTIDYQKLQDWQAKRLWLPFPIVGRCCNRSVSFFFALGVVENPTFAVGIVILAVIVPDIRVLGATLPFSVVGHCCITWRQFIRARHGWKSRTCHWNFDAISVVVQVVLTTSGFGGHFAFPVVVRCCNRLLKLSASSLYSWKPQVCCRDCSAICHTVGD